MLISKQGFATLASDNYIGKWARESGKLDHDDSALSQILPFIKEGDTVLDLGALYGDHSIAYARAVGREGTVHAFEPNPKAFECLEYNMKDFVQVNCVPYGVGNSKEGYIIDYNIDNVGASRLKADKNGVKIMRIDDMELTRCDFIKLDIEGFEIEALDGGELTIKKFSPVLCIEVNRGTLEARGHTPADLFKLLDEYGYSYRNIYAGQPMEGEQYDILCFKNN